jgi:uncharacterized protein YeaO (DUF488 family)
LPVAVKRVYEPPSPDDGLRILVDRVWPRGLSKAAAELDSWERDLAPSAELRKWFGHDPARWPEFRRRYRAELAAPERQASLAALRRQAKTDRVTLLYGARDDVHNQAVVLAELLTEQL